MNPFSRCGNADAATAMRALSIASRRRDRNQHRGGTEGATEFKGGGRVTRRRGGSGFRRARSVGALGKCGCHDDRGYSQAYLALRAVSGCSRGGIGNTDRGFATWTLKFNRHKQCSATPGGGIVTSSHGNSIDDSAYCSRSEPGRLVHEYPYLGKMRGCQNKQFFAIRPP